jgi:hypothetical protein
MAGRDPETACFGCVEEAGVGGGDVPVDADAVKYWREELGFRETGHDGDVRVWDLGVELE